MDISETLAPKSEQLDAIDLMGKPPRIFTVTKVDVKTTAEQPVSVHLAEFPRVWRPGVSMRRVLAYCWGPKSVEWVGRQVELYCDDSVKFGNDVTGGTRISRLSHIDGRKSVPLLLSQGRSGTYKVEPLPTAAPASPAVGPELMLELVEMFQRKGIPSEAQLAGVNKITGGSATDLEAITQDDARKVLAALTKRPDAEVTAEDSFGPVGAA